jgi:hypothetical protein
MWLGGLICAAASLAACSSGTVGQPLGGTGGARAGGSGGAGAGTSGGGAGGGGVTINLGRGGTTGTLDAGGDTSRIDDCTAAAKLVYLVTQQNNLYSFDPSIDGLSAYKRIGTLTCETASTPQSMSVDRLGRAYVFYSSGHLYYVSTTTAQCTPTSYVHPVEPTKSFNQLGMGFTAATPESNDQVLYIHSPDFGLATVDLPTLAVSKLNVLPALTMELTGGPDAVLFGFASSTAELSQIDRTTYQTRAVHKLNLKNVAAFAFARYAGVFYVFTAPTNGMTTTTRYDAQSNTESIRDPDIGFTVVGAGQSICVPPPVIP